MSTGKREQYYNKLKELSKEIKKEWTQIAMNNKNSYSTLSNFAKTLSNTVKELKNEREKEITDIDKANELLEVSKTLHKSILSDIKQQGNELHNQNKELSKQSGLFAKINTFTKGIKENLKNKLSVKFDNVASDGKNILFQFLNDLLKSIKEIVPIVKTAIVVISGVLNSLIKNISAGIGAFFNNIEQKGIRGIKNGAKEAKKEFSNIGTEIKTIVSSSKDVYNTLKQINELESDVEAKNALLQIAQSNLDLFEKQRSVLETTNLTLQERLQLQSKQYAYELNVIQANVSLLNSQKQLLEKELFISNIKKENVKDKIAQISLLNNEIAKLSEQQRLLKQLFQIETQISIIRDVANKGNLDKIKIISELERELKTFQTTVQTGFVLEKEVELTNKAIDKLKDTAKQAFVSVSELANIDTSILFGFLEQGVNPEIVKNELLKIKNLNTQTVTELVALYEMYYSDITDLQNKNFETNKEITERNKNAIVEAITFEYEQRKSVIENTKQDYLDFQTILDDIERSNIDIFSKTFQYVNALKRSIIELDKKYTDNIDKIEKYKELLLEIEKQEAFFIEQVKQRTDLSELEKQNEIEKIKDRYNKERIEIKNTIKEIEKANSDIIREQEKQKEAIKQKYNELFANVFDNLSSIANTVTSELNNYLDRQKGYIDNYITRLQNMYNVQQALLGKVSDLQVDRINREIARAEAEKRRIEKQKEAIETVNTLLQTYNSYLQAGNNPQQALLNAIKDIFLIKAISRAIKGRFAKGVEAFKGAGTETSDSNLVLISKNESIVTAQATKRYKGLVTAMNNNKVSEWVNNNMITANNYGKEYVYDFMRLGNSIVSLINVNNKYTIK